MILLLILYLQTQVCWLFDNVLYYFLHAKKFSVSPTLPSYLAPPHPTSPHPASSPCLTAPHPLNFPPHIVFSPLPWVASSCPLAHFGNNVAIGLKLHQPITYPNKPNVIILIHLAIFMQRIHQPLMATFMPGLGPKPTPLVTMLPLASNCTNQIPIPLSQVLFWDCTKPSVTFDLLQLPIRPVALQGGKKMMVKSCLPCIPKKLQNLFSNVNVDCQDWFLFIT